VWKWDIIDISLTFFLLILEDLTVYYLVFLNIIYVILSLYGVFNIIQQHLNITIVIYGIESSISFKIQIIYGINILK